ncbi:hypothetical protein HPC49_54730, partial [Pyxidicoccus fallax]|nr:hypothetical protein [Pyxidicoccus fallax]
MRFIPLFVLVLLVTSPALAEPDSFGLGTGRNGALGVTAVGQTLNLATPLVSAAPAGSTVLRLASMANLPVGALVLIHQSTGFDSNTPSGGAGPYAPGAVGRWELARIAAVDNTAGLRLTAPLVNGYTVPGAQLVLVPEYTNVTVLEGASLVARAWDGRSGGILAFLATGTVTNRGHISADGAGFRGASFSNHADLAGCTGLDLPFTQGGSYKGEGVVADLVDKASGRGNLVNAGGGGNCHNSGGGGGGHGGDGGKGGVTADEDGFRDEGGLGG